MKEPHVQSNATRELGKTITFADEFVESADEAMHVRIKEASKRDFCGQARVFSQMILQPLRQQLPSRPDSGHRTLIVLHMGVFRELIINLTIGLQAETMYL